jgi:glutathione S-transferase
MRRHGDLRHIYGDAPLANEAAATYFQQQMRTVERALTDNPPYILGDRFTAADLLLSTCITWAIRYGVAVTEPVIAYNKRITARPAYQKALRTNSPPAQTA